MDKKFDALQGFMWSAFTVHFVLNARIQGAFTDAVLGRALAGVGRRYPELAAGVSYDSDSFPYFRLDDPLEIPVRSLKRQDNDHWTREAAVELGRLFPASGPLARLVRLHDGDSSDLMLVFHHSLSEALSAVYVLRDLLTLLGEPERTLPPLPVSTPLLDRLPVAITDALRQMPLPPFITEPVDIPSDAPLPYKRERTDLYVLAWTLGQDDTRALIERCHREGVSVHGALCASFLRAHEEKEPLKPVRRLQSPVSVRRQLNPPADEDFGLYAALLETDIDCNPGRSLWQIASDVTTYFREASTGPSAFADQWMITSALNAMPYPKFLRLLGGGLPVAYDLSISNIGRLTIPLDYGPLRLERLYGPAVIGPDDEKVVGVATLDDQMFFSFTFNPTVTVTVDQARDLQTRAMTILLDNVRS